MLSAGYVNIGAAFIFGIIGSVVCAGVMELMERWGSRYVDDHLVSTPRHVARERIT